MAARDDGLATALPLVALAWITLLGAPPLLAPWVGAELGGWIAAATILVAALLVRDARSSPTGPRLLAPLSVALGVVAAIASYPAWIAAVAALGDALALPAAPPIPPWTPPPLELSRRILLGPVLEEIVYRESLQRALERRLGSSVAIPCTSAVFAASHLEPWPVLASLLLGGVLGILARASGGIALGIGLHAGLNLAGVLFGVPPTFGAPSVPGGAALGGLLLVLGVLLARIVRAGPRRATSSNAIRRTRAS